MFMINNKLDEVYQYDNDIDDDDTSSLSISNKRYQLNNGLKKKSTFRAILSHDYTF